LFSPLETLWTATRRLEENRFVVMLRIEHKDHHFSSIQPAPLCMRRLIACLVVLTCVLRAENTSETKPAANSSERATDEELRIQGIFQGALPGTERKHNLRVTVHPHLGDFQQRNFLRLPVSLRYGFNNRWDANVGVDTYFAHGFGDVKFFDRYGLSRFNSGTKYQLGQIFARGWDTAVEFNYAMPVDHPPPELTDGLRHYAPALSFSHRLEHTPSVRYFWGAGCDLIEHTKVVGERRKNDIFDNTLLFTTGVVWERRAWTYTLEGSVATSRWIGNHEPEEVYTIRPAVIWQLPKRFTFYSSGRWLLGVGLRATHGPDGNDFGISGKLRVSFDFKRWWRHVTGSKP
jgi:hypothetical protein